MVGVRRREGKENGRGRGGEERGWMTVGVRRREGQKEGRGKGK